MLDTNLKHLETGEDVHKILEENENVVICCGRMGPMCMPVYYIMEELESLYPHVAFRDQDFDIPAADFVKRLPECAYFQGAAVHRVLQKRRGGGGHDQHTKQDAGCRNTGSGIR